MVIQLENKKRKYKDLFRKSFKDRNDYTDFLLFIIPLILGENTCDDFESKVVESVEGIIEAIIIKYEKSEKESLKMLLYAFLDGMISIEDLFGFNKELSNSAQVIAYQEFANQNKHPLLQHR